MALTWQGQRITAKLKAAMVAGVNQTMAAAVARAKRSHNWRNRTGTLEGSIDVVEFAKPVQGGVRGVWGSRDVRYALIHEIGGTIRPKRARALFIRDVLGDISAVVKEVTIPPRPYLRPAADAEYPNLAARIRKALRSSPGASS